MLRQTLEYELTLLRTQHGKQNAFTNQLQTQFHQQNGSTKFPHLFSLVVFILFFLSRCCRSVGRSLVFQFIQAQMTNEALLWLLFALASLVYFAIHKIFFLDRSLNNCGNKSFYIVWKTDCQRDFIFCLGIQMETEDE